MGKMVNLVGSNDVVRIEGFSIGSMLDKMKDIFYKMIPAPKKHLVVLIFKDFNDMKKEYDNELRSIIDIRKNKRKSYDFFVILNNKSDEHYFSMLNYIDGVGPEWLCMRTCTMTAWGEEDVEDILHNIVDDCEGYTTINKFRF